MLLPIIVEAIKASGYTDPSLSSVFGLNAVNGIRSGEKKLRIKAELKRR